METQPERAVLMIQERKAHFEIRRAARQYHRASDPEGRDKAREKAALLRDCILELRKELETAEIKK